MSGVADAKDVLVNQSDVAFALPHSLKSRGEKEAKSAKYTLIANVMCSEDRKVFGKKARWGWEWTFFLRRNEKSISKGRDEKSQLRKTAEKEDSRPKEHH